MQEGVDPGPTRDLQFQCPDIYLANPVRPEIWLSKGSKTRTPLVLLNDLRASKVRCHGNGNS